MTCARCNDVGWVCEVHPDQPSMHNGCREAGDPCPDCNAGDPPRPPSDWLSLAKVDDADVRPDLDRHTREQRALLHNAPKAAPRQAAPGELLFEFMRGHDRFRCELRDHRDYGVEVQFYQNEEFLRGRRFDPRLDPMRTPRAMAIAWAEEERNAIEKGAE